MLLQAAAQLQAVSDGWQERQAELAEVLFFNRKLWTILVTSVTSEDSQLAADIRQNVANLGLFVMKQTVAATGAPHPDKLRSLIHINQELAAGLLGRA